MTSSFEYFVVFAEMRTGSNFLEANLNALDCVTCHGEAFNPHFIGYPKSETLLGVTKAQRDADPRCVISAIRNDAAALGGFRYFHNHDARVLDTMLDDPRCAKIILTRNPAESYVSWKIAKATGQWKLTDVKRRKDGLAEFDAEEFDQHVADLQAFQLRLMRHLQRTGQTAFYVDYEDLQSVEVMNGLARFLGVSARLEALDKTLKVQNPSPLSDKVANFTDMEKALAGIDRFNMTRTPNFEPRRGAVVPTYVLGSQAPLVFLPIKCGAITTVETWLAALDGTTPDGLQRRLNQKQLRQWKRGHRGHRTFTVLRHPLARAHCAFCTHILGNGPDAYPQIRKNISKTYNLSLPDGELDASWTLERHREAFAGFLVFLKANLSGQTAIRVDAAWATQSHIVQGFAEFMLPDVILREEDIVRDLPELATRVGARGDILPETELADAPFALEDIYDDSIEALAQAAYTRDYMMFGFENWR